MSASRSRFAIIEALEARIAPAVFTVTSLVDLDRAGTLRHAIVLANAHSNSGNTDGDADEIVFARGVVGTIYLRSDLPEITDALTISGPGYTRLVVNGLSAHRPFSIGNAGDVEIKNLTVSSGRAEAGGAVLIDDPHSTVTFTNVLITKSVARSAARTADDNTAPLVKGGGIDVEAGTLLMTGSAVTGNSAVGTFGLDAFGGGIFVAQGASARLEKTLVSGNYAIGAAGVNGGRALAGANGANGGPGEDGNDGEGGANGSDGTSGGSGHGGGIYSDGDLSVIASRITGNAALGGNGGYGSAGGAGGNGGLGGRGFGSGEDATPAGSSGASGSGGKGGDGGTGGNATGGGIEHHSNLNVTDSLISGNLARAGNAGQAGLGGHPGYNSSPESSGPAPGDIGTPGHAGDASGGGFASYFPAGGASTGITEILIQGSLITSNRVTGGAGLNGFAGHGGSAGVSGGRFTSDDGDDGRDGAAGTNAVSGGFAIGGGIASNATLRIFTSTIAGNVLQGGAGGVGGGGGNGGAGGNALSTYRDADDPTMIHPTGTAGKGGTGGQGGSGGDGGAAYGAGISSLADVLFISSTAYSNVATGGAAGRAGLMGRTGAFGYGTRPEPGDPGEQPEAPINGVAGASEGGALRVGDDTTSNGDLTLQESTIGFNRAGTGGAIAFVGGALTVHNSTIVANFAGKGGGLFVSDSSSASVVSSIIARNTAAVSADILGAFDATYSLLGAGVDADLGNASFHNLIGVDPRLRPLAVVSDGPAVFVPLANSPVIDKGSDPDDAASDQRGGLHSRKLGIAVDIGSVELK